MEQQGITIEGKSLFYRQYFFKAIKYTKKLLFERKNIDLLTLLKDPSHPRCTASLDGEIRHFRCHQNYRTLNRAGRE